MRSRLAAMAGQPLHPHARSDQGHLEWRRCNRRRSVASQGIRPLRLPLSVPRGTLKNQPVEALKLLTAKETKVQRSKAENACRRNLETHSLVRNRKCPQFRSEERRVG